MHRPIYLYQVTWVVSSTSMFRDEVMCMVVDFHTAILP
jgi:hypothetical protein